MSQHKTRRDFRSSQQGSESRNDTAADGPQQVRFLAGRFRSTNAKEKFSPSEWLILMALDQNPGIELKQLADLVRLGTGAVAKVTRTLGALRLIEWRKDSSSRRHYVLSVTNHGKAVCKEGREAARVQTSDWFRGLTVEELAVITGLLEKCMPMQEVNESSEASDPEIPAVNSHAC